MNIKERIEIVKAMDLLCRQINDEEVFMTWLIYGVADGDVEIGDDERLECYVDDDERFAELLGLFLSMMSRAKKSGGLYADRVLSKE